MAGRKKISKKSKTSKEKVTIKTSSHKGTKTKKGSFNIQCDEKNRIICEYSMFKGREYLNIRYQFLNDQDEWKHGYKGISIPFYGNVANEFIEKFKKEF